MATEIAEVTAGSPGVEIPQVAGPTLAEIQQQVQKVYEAVDSLRRAVDGIKSTDFAASARSSEPFDSGMLEVLRVTQEMFPGGIRVEQFIDPDDPYVEAVVIRVRTADSPPEIVSRRLEWHERISQVSRSSQQYRLMVIPEE